MGQLLPGQNCHNCQEQLRQLRSHGHPKEGATSRFLKSHHRRLTTALLDKSNEVVSPLGSSPTVLLRAVGSYRWPWPVRESATLSRFFFDMGQILVLPVRDGT